MDSTRTVCERELIKAAHNSTFAIGGVLCFVDSFEVTESSVHRMSICTENPAHRKSAERYEEHTQNITSALFDNSDKSIIRMLCFSTIHSQRQVK